MNFRELHSKLSYKTIYPKNKGPETIGERLERQRLEDMGLQASVFDDTNEFFDNLLDESHLMDRVLDFRGSVQ